MSRSTNPAHLVLRCDGEGAVREVLRDDLAVLGDDAVGRPFSRVFAPGSRTKATTFLEEIRARRGAAQWELLVEDGRSHRLVHLAGGRLDDGGFLVIGADSPQEASEVSAELLRIGDEQISLLRSATRDRSALERSVQGDAGEVVEELTRVNNELTNLQRELARKNAELERLDREKNRFLGMAAHDLRNPLGVIRAYSEFLLSDEARDPESRDARFLQVIRDSSRFMGQLVNELLDVAKIESGAVKLDPETVDLGALVERCVRLNRVFASAKEITLEVSTEGSVDARVDPSKVEQVLNNLLTNAVKYSEAGTAVWVRVVREGECIVVAVSDEGQGIPADELDDLFQPFVATSVKATAGETSTGLGLTITRRIVEAHGGTITVESQVGEGSTFTVRLPIG